MLWHEIYGFKNSILNKKYIKNKQSKIKYSSGIYTKPLHTKLLNTSYIIPKKWKIIVLKDFRSKILFFVIYSRSYILFLPLFFTKYSVNFDLNLNQINLNYLFSTNYNKLYLSILNSFVKSLVVPTFNKLKFKGKGYYIYKNYRNTITPQFGYSHRLYLYSFHTHIKFLSKTDLILFGLNRKCLSSISQKLFLWRPVNIFTGRGVRFSKQIFYKKSGKISSYR